MKMKRNATFAKRLNQYRKDNNLTLVELEKKTGVPAQTLNRYELGQRIPKVDTAVKIAEALHISSLWLQGYDDEPNIENLSEPQHLYKIPVYGTIVAGYPMFAVENIEGYELADVENPEEYFYLRVKGDSMINARILDGDRVLIHKQPSAENGQIVACIVNGDEATLKRFKMLDTAVMLLPENSAYDPIIVSASDFNSGYAKVLGIVDRVVFKP